MDEEKQKRYNVFMDKLRTQEMYFVNTFEEAAIKSTPGPEGASDGILEYTEIIKEEFYNF